MQRANLISSRCVGDFNEGEVYHHGAIQITPMRNREYINKYRDGLILGANPELGSHLGYEDPDYKQKKGKYGIEKPALVSQGFVFNAGFGLSVHDISFNAIANLSYSDLRFGVPVFEGDVIYGKSQVLGREFRKDGATNGSGADTGTADKATPGEEPGGEMTDEATNGSGADTGTTDKSTEGETPGGDMPDDAAK